MKEKVTFLIEEKKFAKLCNFTEEHKKCPGISAGEKFCFKFVPTMLGVCPSVYSVCVRLPWQRLPNGRRCTRTSIL